MTDRELLQKAIARISEISNDCFDQRARRRLHELAQELERSLNPPAPDKTA